MPTVTTAWLDCPRCHQTRAASIPAPRPAGSNRGRWALCPECREPRKVREIRVTWTAGHPLTRECPPECLNGTSDCTCRCGGRCHGLRVCQCRGLPPFATPEHDHDHGQGTLL